MSFLSISLKLMEFLMFKFQKERYIELFNFKF
jgi:hypothetical protein